MTQDNLKQRELNMLELLGAYTISMQQRALKNVKKCLNTNIYSYLETSGGQSYNLYLNAVN